jgi:S1-C subfamily serine protease
VTTRAALASAVIIALVAGIAGGVLALALRGEGGGRTTVTTVVRSGSGSKGGFDPVALYAGSRNGVVTIEATFGVDDQTAGSGFVVNARRGLIVTASHVVARAKAGSASAT